MAADGLRETSEVRSFMSAATNVNPRDPAGTIRAITASAIGAVAQVRNDNPDMLESVMQVRLRVIKAPTRGGGKHTVNTEHCALVTKTSHRLCIQSWVVSQICDALATFERLCKI